MRIKNIFMILFIYLLLFFAGCSGKEGPVIKLDGDTYKFGSVNEGKQVFFTFFFSNTGSEDLVIKNILVSCLCLDIKECDKILKPGERGKLYGVMNTEGFPGTISKAVRVETNIHGSTSTFHITGTVIPKEN